MSFSHTKPKEEKPNPSFFSSLSNRIWGSKNSQEKPIISSINYPEINDAESLLSHESSPKELNFQAPESPQETDWEEVPRQSSSSLTDNSVDKETSDLSTSEPSEEDSNKTSLLIKSISNDTANSDKPALAESALPDVKQESQNTIKSLENDTYFLVNSYEKALADNKILEKLLKKRLLKESDTETEHKIQLSTKDKEIEALNNHVENLQNLNKNYQNEQKQIAKKHIKQSITANKEKASLQKELNILTNKKSELETSLEKISAEKAILQTSLDQEQSTKVELQRQLLEEKSRSNRLNKLVEEDITFKKQMEISLNTEITLKKELQELLNREMSAKKELQKLLEQEASLKEEFKKSLDTEISAKKELQKLLDQETSLKAELKNSFEEERHIHQENINELEKSILRLKVNLEATMLAHEENQNKLQEKNEYLQKENVALTKLSKNINHEKKQLEQSLKIQAIKEDELKEELANLQDRTSFIQQLKNTYKHLYTKVNGECLQSKKEILTLSKLHSEDKDSLAKLSKINDEYKEQHVNLSQQNMELTTRLQAAEKELKNTFTIAKDSQALIKEQSLSLDDRTKQLQAAEDKVKELTQSNARLKTQADENSTLHTTIWSLKSANSILKEEKNKTLEEADKVKDELNKTKDQLAIKHNENDSLKKEIETLKELIALFRIENLSQKDQLKHLEKQLQEKQRDEINITKVPNHLETIATKQILGEKKDISVVKNPAATVTPQLTITQDEKYIPAIGDSTSTEPTQKLTYAEALVRGNKSRTCSVFSVFKQNTSSLTRDQAPSTQDQETQKKTEGFSYGC